MCQSNKVTSKIMNPAAELLYLLIFFNSLAPHLSPGASRGKSQSLNLGNEHKNLAFWFCGMVQVFCRIAFSIICEPQVIGHIEQCRSQTTNSLF
jgi:hypothetical protein